MTTKKEIALEVRNISKSFRLPIEQASGIKQAFINRVKGIKGYREQNVLNDISFTVEKGDFFGIVGRNGSGKSTLLKLISKIYTPNSGEITVNGTLVPFIELGVGFNPELTGRENVYLNGAMLGFSNAEIDKMYDDIVDFAELHDFMDQKLKNYSSGMQVRLAFSVAIKAQGDILVLDEVLAVGDEAFQRKCNEYFDEIRKDRNRTVILVTHNMDAVRKFCDHALMIRDGEVVISGSPDDVADQYSEDNFKTLRDGCGSSAGVGDYISRLDIIPVSRHTLRDTDSFCEFCVEFETKKDLPVCVNLRISDEVSNALIASRISKIVERAGKYSFKYKFPIGIFGNIGIVIRARLESPGDNRAVIAFTDNQKAVYFKINKGDREHAGLLGQDTELIGDWQ